MLYLARPFHVLVWKNDQAMVCNMYGENFQPVEYTRRAELCDGRLFYGPDTNRQMQWVSADDGRTLLPRHSLDINITIPLQLAMLQYRPHPNNFQWLNTYWELDNNTKIHWVCCERENTRHRIPARNGHIIDILFMKEDMDVFEQLVCLFVSPYLLKDLCKFVASFM